MQWVENNHSKTVIFAKVIPTGTYVELVQNSCGKLVLFWPLKLKLVEAERSQEFWENKK